jgi:hypothetical protein
VAVSLLIPLLMWVRLLASIASCGAIVVVCGPGPLHAPAPICGVC